MKTYRTLLIAFCLPVSLLCLFSCPLSSEWTENELSFEVLWEAPMYIVHNAHQSIIHGNTIYVQQGSGMIAVNIDTGQELWRTVGGDKVAPYSEMVVIDDYLLFVGISLDSDNELRRDLWLMNRYDGSLAGRNKLLCPDFEPVADWDYYFYQSDWILYHENKVILPVKHMMDSGHYCELGIYTFDFSAGNFSMDDSLDPIVMDTLYTFLPRQDGETNPVIDGNRMYIYAGGSAWRGALPAGVDPSEEGYYYQENIHVAAIDLDTGTVAWKAFLKEIGDPGNNDELILQEGVLHVADYEGYAAIDTATGEVLYEKVMNNRFGFMGGWRTYDDGVLYYPFYNATLTAVRASDGKILWSHQPEEYIHNRESNPLIWGDRVYMVDPEGLRAYNKKTGQYYGLQESLGAPGNRIPGYIPFKDDIIYIPQTTKLVAVRLGSEK